MTRLAHNAVESLKSSPVPTSELCLVPADPLSPPTNSNSSRTNAKTSTIRRRPARFRCEATTKLGQRCRAIKLRSGRFCFYHDPSPEVVEARLIRSRKGGLGGILPDELHKAHRAQERADLRKLPPADFRRVIRLVYREFCRRQKRGDIRDRAWPRVGDRPT